MNLSFCHLHFLNYFLIKFLNYKEKVFKNLDYKISLVDIKGKGIYFRLLAGPFENIEKATLVCNDIKKINLNCFPIKEF